MLNNIGMNYKMLTVCCKPVLYVIMICYTVDRPQFLKVVAVKESELRAVNYCDEKVFTVDNIKKTLNVLDGKTLKLMSTLDVSESVWDIVSCSCSSPTLVPSCEQTSRQYTI